MVKTKNGKLYVGFWPKEQRRWNEDEIEAAVALVVMTAMLLWGVINLF